MRRLIGSALALAATLFATAFAYAQSYTAPGDAQPRAYVGSNACERCHPDEFTSWRRALHVQMTKPIAEARRALDAGRDGRSRPAGRAAFFWARLTAEERESSRSAIACVLAGVAMTEHVD